ncbi:FimV/HubP family polar landmark protein [Aromatoleum diolicum]|uniref:FimV N-terminal domain-containing protein n=1 Tax=Aromatoleum diolicum TaxID=75796 RepID=A0ABX1QBH8_9RHOO|nr:FimV/HubP family polar landmark protein [Aromatoleum diolicum]NMG74817.1 hypothetical protein [Aromatoleum diolicum]
MKTSIKASLIATAIAMLPLGSHAAGLGSIHVFSGIGQPLRAEVELNASSEELQSLSARVAPPEAFKQASLQYTSAMTALRFSVERRGSRSVVKIASERPFNEPFVDLLIELNWAAGRLLREYTFLLDPVPVGAPAPTVSRSAAPVSSPSAASVAAPTRRAAPAGSSGTDRYEIQKGDTLRRIAEANRPEGASLDQMLIALFRENPTAFDGQNINRLRAGAIVAVPDEIAVRAIDPVQARREVQAQSADFNAYRRKLAGTVASRPAAADQTPSRSDAGAIVPKVSEPARTGSGDQVRVSGAPTESAESRNSDSTRLARLQALEEELVARDKALEEANSRLAALEASIQQMQQLLALRNQNLAQLQQQAAAGTAAQAAAAPAPAEAPATPSDASAPAQPAGPAPAVPVQEMPSVEPAKPAPTPPTRTSPPAAEPSFVQSLLDDPMMLAGGGGILALLLAYAGLKVRQRRNHAQGMRGVNDRASEFPPETNSVFGATGGQSVNTGESSVLHTDFSQSGLSAIDTDEGVDPVAEADVYMAYGRDAQAEEILLDALKNDSTRTAIYLKLLEIYAQRKNLKAFETTATDLYSRTGGEGQDWEKAAEMGRRIDPDNPLYRASAAMGRGSASDTLQPQGAAAAVGVAAAATAIGYAESARQASGETLSGLDFVTSFNTEAGAPSPTSPQLESVAGLDDAAPTVDVEIEALPEVDSDALDFDLDAGLDLGDVAPPAAGVTLPGISVPAGGSSESELDLGLDIGELTGQSAAEEAISPPRVADPMEATVVGQGFDFASAEQALEFDLAPAIDASAVGSALSEADLNATVVGTEGAPVAEDADGGDLEKTSFDSSLLDFDFNLEDTGEPASAPLAPTPMDLSSIDLNLDTPETELPPLTSGSGEASAVDVLELSEPEMAAGNIAINSDVLEEVNTKLELARAYEEMGDAEGARELIEEVLREGSADQREAASRLKERLG